MICYRKFSHTRISRACPRCTVLRPRNDSTYKMRVLQISLAKLVVKLGFPIYGAQIALSRELRAAALRAAAAAAAAADGYVS